MLIPAFFLQGPWTESVFLAATAAIGVVFICGGIQGYQFGIGDLRSARNFEWPLRTLLIVGGFALAAPGGGISPLSHVAMTTLAVALLAPAIVAALWFARRAQR